MQATRKRLSAIERREVILDAAKNLFAARGLHGVSVDEIAAASDVSPAVIYRHFPSKDALYAAVLERIACKRESYIQAVIDTSTEFSDVLRLLTKTYVDSILAEPAYLRMEMLNMLEGHAFSSEFFENRWRPIIEYIEVELPETLRTQGSAQTDTRAAGLMFQGFLREALYQKLLVPGGRYAEEPADDLIERMIVLFLDAVGITRPDQTATI